MHLVWMAIRQALRIRNGIICRAEPYFAVMLGLSVGWPSGRASSCTSYPPTPPVEAARKYNRVVQAGTQQRSGKHYQNVAAFIQSGKLGHISDNEGVGTSLALQSQRRFRLYQIL
jgi:hypothetical protein